MWCDLSWRSRTLGTSIDKKKPDENVNKVRELVHGNRRITTREVANMLRISYTGLNNTEWSQMIFAYSESYYQIISQDNTWKLSDVRLKLSKFWIKGCTSSFNDLPPGALQSRKRIWPMVRWNKCMKLIVRCCQENLECTRLLSHPLRILQTDLRDLYV